MYKNIFNIKLKELTPMPVEIEPVLKRLKGIKALLFDIYGTLLISGSGDISISSGGTAEADIKFILEKSGFILNQQKNDLLITEGLVKKSINRHIKETHRELINNGICCPEVEIREIWEKVIADLKKNRIIKDTRETADTEKAALMYELSVNPVWPMPGFPEITDRLENSGFILGIVSNAQFYTKIIIEELTGRSLDNLGFREDFCEWSYRIKKAKPSPEIFKKPLENLEKKGIKPENILYIGNDMLNDVSTAASCGCRTALFAGDKRSLRLREEDNRVKVRPDIIITDLMSIQQCLEL